MSKKGILLAITNGVWLINQGAIEAFAPSVVDIFAGKSFWAEIDKTDPAFLLSDKVQLISSGREPYYAKDLSYSNASPQSVAVINIEGPIMKHDNCGDPGTRTYESLLQAAYKNPNIAGIILNMDTPGGTVDGTESLANLIRMAEKPIVAFTDGLIASAGYWLASGCAQIIASSATAQIGSIGVASSFADNSEMFEKLGIKSHYIVADGSEDKNKSYMEARKGNYDTYKKEMLNPIRTQFVSHVKETRGTKLKLSDENVLSGKVYIAADALQNGLIDAIGTLNDAIEKTFELAGMPSSENTSKENSNQTNMKKITLLAVHAGLLAFCGATIPAGKTSVEVDLTDDQLNSLNATVAGAEKAKTDLAAAVEKITALETAATTSANKITGLEADVKTKGDRIAELEKMNPGATGSQAEGDEDTGASTKENIYETEADVALAQTKSKIRNGYV